MKAQVLLGTMISTAAALAVARPPAPPVTIPLCPGLTVVTAVAQPEGDYESIKVVEGIDASGVRLKYSSERVARDLPGHPIRKLNVARVVRTADLQGATKYLQEFSTLTPAEVPGTTAIGISSAVLRALKTTGAAGLVMFDFPASLPADHPYSADPKVSPSVFEHEVAFKLRRVETGAVMLPLIVNDTKVDVPAIHAMGAGEWGEKAEFYFLDDERNPLALKWRIRTSNVSSSDRAVLEVVKIACRCTSAPVGQPSALERALSEAGRADVYDIYFSFNSDAIRDESEPTLRELGEVLRRHADWKLTIDGHTDGIASDAFNLDLSKRRAAAVKNALVTRYKIDPARLATNGYGKSRPRDTNDTPEGRARNRRVELVRQ